MKTGKMNETTPVKNTTSKEMQKIVVIVRPLKNKSIKAFLQDYKNIHS